MSVFGASHRNAGKVQSSGRPVQQDRCPYKRQSGHRWAQRERACEEPGEKQPPKTKERGGPEQAYPANHPWVDFKNCENINYCCLSHSVCGTLSQQPWGLIQKPLYKVVPENYELTAIDFQERMTEDKMLDN